MKSDDKIKFYILQEEFPHEIHDALSMFFVLKGNLIVEINRSVYTVYAGGFFVIPPFSVFKITHASSENVAIEIRVDYDYLEQCGWPKYIREHFTVCDDKPDVKSDAVRKLFADCYRQSTYGDDVNVAIAVQHLVKEIRKNLSISAENSKSMDAQMQHVDHVLFYIWEHWKEEIDTNNLAQTEFLSASYLSHLFKRWMNRSVVKYVTEVRLFHAYRKFEYSSASVTRLALEHGFKNTNMFINSFKEKYGNTPGKYRKIRNINHKKDNVSYDFSSLLRYASKRDVRISEEMVNIRLTGLETEKCNFSENWKNLMNVAFAKDLLLEPIQRQLRIIQEKIGFRYIHFHGIFDREMYVYDEDEQGNPRYSFFYLDWVFDFLNSVRLKLYLDFGNMPYVLAKHTRKPYMKTRWFSTYSSKKKWEDLIKATLLHLVGRYGIDEVRSWYFVSFPLLPDEAGELGMMPEGDYYEFYETTRNAVKAVDKDLRFGGPGSFSHELWTGKRLQRFLDYSHRHGCEPDFYTFRGYPNNHVEYNEEFGMFSEDQNAEPMIPSADAHYTKHFLDEWKKLAGKYGDAEKEVWLEEWNATIWQRDPAHDTAFKAAWLMKNICENYQSAKAFGYWMMLDFNEEHGLQIPAMFHGGMGMITINGIPKSSWIALELLNKVRGSVIAQGDNWLVVKNESELQIILYHYCHYNSFLLRRDKVFIARENVYQLFVQKDKMKITVEIDHCYEKKYYASQIVLNREYGSAFDRWVHMGMPSYLDKTEEGELQYAAHPLLKSHILYPESGKLNLTFDMQPHEVQLWIIKNIM